MKNRWLVVMVLIVICGAALVWSMVGGPHDPRSKMLLAEPGEYHTAILPDGQPPWLAHVPGRRFPFLVCFDGTRIEANPTGKIITHPGESTLNIPAFTPSDYPVYWVGDDVKWSVYRCSDGVKLLEH